MLYHKTVLYRKNGLNTCANITANRRNLYTINNTSILCCHFTCKTLHIFFIVMALTGKTGYNY